MSKPRPSRPMKVDRTVSRSFSDDSTCNVCHESIEFFAIGHCDHPICYKCSTRMRVLCDQMYCAICRADIPKVAFIRRLIKFDHLKLDSFCINREKFIFFEDEVIRSAYNRLLENRCKICKDLPSFPSFKQLEAHIKKEHELFCCGLCMENLKLFSCDRKFYDRKQLAEHKRHGDSNETSYRLHPLCKFCDKRYFDNDELLRHLRKDHYYCHFCEADGINNEYFEEYAYLRDHFREQHLLCEEDECARTEFTNAFRSEIDLKAHVSATHSKHLGRQQARQLRTIDIDINYGPRSQDGGRRGNPRHRGGPGGGPRFEDRGGAGPRFEDRGGAGPRFEDRGGGRTQRSEQRHREEQQKRTEIDTAYAISLSLSEAQRQGSVCVMDQQLAENSRLVPSSQNTAAAEKSNFNAASDDFPSLRGEKQPGAKLPVQNGEKNESKASTNSLAQVLAFNTGRSVRSGALDEADFPSLGGSRKPSGSSKTKSGVWQQNGSQTSGSVSNLAEKQKGNPKAAALKSKEFESLNGASASVNMTSAFRKSVTTPNFMDFPVLGTSSNKAQISGTWVKKKENVEPVQPAQPERSGLLKLEMKNKGKQRRDNQPTTVNAKQSKLEKSDASDKQNEEGDKSQEVQKSAEIAKPVQSLADIASRLAGNSKLENEFSKKGLPLVVENTVEVSSNEKKKQKKSRAEKESVFMLKERKVAEKDLRKESSSQISSAVAKASGSRNVADDASKSLDKGSIEQQSVTEKKSKDIKEKSRSMNVDGSEKSGTKSKGKLKNEENSKDLEKAEMDMAELKFESNDFPKLMSKQKKVVNSKQADLESKEVLQLRVDAPEFRMLWPCDTKDESGVSEKEKSIHSDKDLSKGFEAIKQEEKRVAVSEITSSDCNFKHATVSETLDSSESSDLITAESSLGNVVHVSSDPLPAESSLENVDFQPKFAPSDFPSLMGSSANAVLATETVGVSPLFMSNNLSHLSTYPVSSEEFLTSNALRINSDICSSIPSLQHSTAPPPGFSSATVKPPPGFSSKAPASKPPPGFTKPSISEPDGVLNGFADTATQNLCRVPPTASSYIPPKRSLDRNAKLIGNIMNETTDATFDRFKESSLNFRQNHIDAKEYYSQCSEVIGTEAFQKIFPELVVLLPNIEKQQELLSAHRAHVSKSSSKKTHPWSKMDNEVFCCTFCGQVILHDDSTDHWMEHGTMDSKPAL